jgi:hypothetical protein
MCSSDDTSGQPPCQIAQRQYETSQWATASWIHFPTGTIVTLMWLHNRGIAVDEPTHALSCEAGVTQEWQPRADCRAGLHQLQAIVHRTYK